MKHLRVYYKFEDRKIDSDFDKEIEKIAKKRGLKFKGSGYEIYTGKRSLHYG